MKKGFILYKDAYEPIKLLTQAQKGELLDAIFEYNISGKELSLSVPSTMAFQFLKPHFDRDIEKYNNICDRNAENGKKGGRPKSNPENPVGYLETQKKRVEPKKAHIDIDIDKDKDIHIDKEIDKDKKKTSRFTPPSLQEIKDYILNNKYSLVNADVFYNHYEANGWKVGKNKMKDWKRSVSGWEARSKQEKGDNKNERRNGKGYGVNRQEVAELLARRREELGGTSTDTSNIVRINESSQEYSAS